MHQSDINVQAEIRIDVLRNLFRENNMRAFLCHYIAFMLRDEIAKGPDYQKYYDARYASFINWHQDEEERNFELNSIPYFYLVDERKDSYGCVKLKFNDLSNQVMAQLNVWLEKLFPNVQRYHKWIGTDMITHLVGKDVTTTYQENQWQARMNLLDKILELDPDAVLSINM